MAKNDPWAVVSEEPYEPKADPWAVVSEMDISKAGGGRGYVNPANAADDQGQLLQKSQASSSSRVDRLNASDKWTVNEMSRLKEINPDITDADAANYAADRLKQAKSQKVGTGTSAPSSDLGGEFDARVTELQRQGYDTDAAIDKAMFDMGFNAKQAAKKADVRGDRANLPQFQGEQNTPEFMDAARKKEAERVRIENMRDAGELDMSPQSVAQDIGAGALKVLPTAVKGVTDIASMATGGTVGRDSSKAIQDYMNGIDKYIGSERAADQKRGFERDMSDPNVSILDAILNNKAALADQILPQLGSMFMPVGAAKVAGNVAQVGKYAKALDEASKLARIGKAEEAAVITSTVLQNASDTFNTVLDKGGSLQDAYLAAGITAPFSAVAGKVFDGGAEMALAKRLFNGRGEFTGGVAKAFGKEAGQETTEQFGQSLGEAAGTGEDLSPNRIGKEMAVAGILGGVVGGGVHVASGGSIAPVDVSPEAEIARAIQSNVDSTSFNQDATTQQVRDVLSPNRDTYIAPQQTVRPTVVDVLQAPSVEAAIQTTAASLPSIDISAIGQNAATAISDLQAITIPATTEEAAVAPTAAPVEPSAVPQVGVRQKSPSGMEYTINEGGSVTLHGDPDAVKTAFPGERSMKDRNGLRFGATRAQEILGKLGVSQATPEETVGTYPTAEAAKEFATSSGIADTTEVIDTDNGFVLAPLQKKDTIRDLNQEALAVSNLAAAVAGTGERGTVLRYEADADGKSDAQHLVARTATEVGRITQSIFGFKPILIEGSNGLAVQNDGNIFLDVPNLAEKDGGKNSLQAIVLHAIGHETGHNVLEKSKDPNDKAAFRNLKMVVSQYLRDGVVADRQTKESAASQEAGGKAKSTEYAENEVMADISGSMWMDHKFWGRLYEVDNGSTMRRVAYRFMQAATRFISAAKGSRLDINSIVTDVDAVREAMAKAWAVSAARNRSIQSRTQIKNTLFEQAPTEPVSYSRGVIGEVAPHPEQEVAKEWDAMDDGEKQVASRATANKITQRVFDEMGLRGWTVDHSSGSWNGKTNPNFIITAPDSATTEQIHEAARVLGHVYDQQAMVAFDEDNTESDSQAGFVKVILPKGMPESKVNELRKWIATHAPRAGSDTLRNGALVYGNFTKFDEGKPELSDEDYQNQILAAANSFEPDAWDIDVNPIRKSHSELIWPDNRNAYLEGTRYGSEAKGLEAGGDNLRTEQRGSVNRLSAIAADAGRLRQQWIDNSTSGRERTRRDELARASAASVAGSSEREYGKGIEGSTAAVGTHFSQQRRSAINSEYYGRGLKGAEAQRLEGRANDDIRPRTYFYVDKGNGITPEAGVGGIKHTVKLNNLYDANADALGLAKESKADYNAFERSVKNSGFDGYLMDTGAKQKFAVLIGRHNIEMPKPSFSRDFDFDELGAFNLDANDDYGDEPLSFKDEDLTLRQIEEQSAREEAERLQRLTIKSAAPTAEQIAEHTFHPEDAFTFGEAHEDSDGVVEFAIPSFLNVNPEHVNIKRQSDDTYYVRVRAGDKVSFLSSAKGLTMDGAVKYAQRQIAGDYLHKNGHDINSAYRKGTILKIAAQWKELAKAEGVFKYPNTDSKAETFPELAKDMGMFGEYKVASEYGVVFFNKDGLAKPFNATVSISKTRMEVCTMGLAGSDIGTGFYAVAGKLAQNLGKRFHADDTLSVVNTYRRTEQVMSFALKTGDSGVMLPGVQNRVYGYNVTPKNKEDHDKNLARFALANLRNVEEVIPDVRRWKYDAAGNVFTDSRGRSVESKVAEALKDVDVRALGIGRSTIARAVLTSQIVANDPAVYGIKKFASAVAYSRDIDSEPVGEGWGDPAEKGEKVGLNPNLKTFLGESKIVHPDGTPIVMFHGTAQDIREFRPKQAGAIFLTDRPEFAHQFADFSAEWMSRHAEQVLAPEQLEQAKAAAIKTVMSDILTKMSERKAMAEEIRSGKPTGAAQDAFIEAANALMPSGPNIMPLVVRAENPFDYKNEKHRNELIEMVFHNAEMGLGGEIKMWGDGSKAIVLEARKGGMSITKGMMEVSLEDGEWSMIEEPELQTAIRDLGHDSFYVVENGQRNLAVYEPNQIKSATGNNGDYDYSKADISFSRSLSDGELEKAKTDLKLWTEAFMSRQDDATPEAMLVSKQATPRLRMAGLSAGEPIYMTKNALRHAERSKHPIEPNVVAKLPSMLGLPRTVLVSYESLDGKKQISFTPKEGYKKRINVITEQKDAAGNPYLIALAPSKKATGITDVTTLFGKDASLKYVLEALRQGAEVVMPDSEIARLRAITGRALIAREPQSPVTAKPNSLRSEGERPLPNQAKPTIYGSESMSKFVSGGDWRAAANTLDISDSDVASAGDLSYSRKQIIGQTERQYTPEQLKAFDNVGFRTDKLSLKERMQALWQDAGKKMAQGLADQFAPIAEFDKEAYGLMRLSKGASGAFEALLQGGKLKLTDKVYDFDETQKGGVVEKLLVPLGGEHHDFFRWVAANRAERLSAEDREHLFSAQDIAAIKTLATGQTDFDYKMQNGLRRGAITRDRALIYGDALKTFDAFNRNVMDMAEQSGLIDPDSRAIWEHEFYVPFYRVSDEDGFGGARVKSGVVRQQAFKELKGGKDKLNTDLLDNTLMNWAHLLDASAKNRAAMATLIAAQDMGIAIEAPESTARAMGKSINNKRGVVWAMDEGKQRFFLVDDPYVLTALNGLEFAGFKGPIMDAMSSMKHWLTVGVTASPFFKIRNLIRDSVQAISVGNLSYNPVKNVVEGFKLSDREGDEHFRLLASGGTIHFGTMYEGSEAKRVQALVESGVKDFTILNDPIKVKAFYRKFIEPAITAYNELGNRGEEINRASLYDQLVKQGVSHADAALQARDLMDFSMQGSFNTIRFLTQVVPFMNARIQGLHKLGRGAKEDPARFSAVLGAVALMSLGLLAAYHDDDDWKQREEFDRNGYWWFKFGGTAFRIPKPFEVGAIATLAERGFERMFDREMTNERFMKQVMTLLGDNLSMNPIPQVVKPILDVYSNKDSFSGREIESAGMERLEPQYRFNQNSSMAARGTSSAMSAVIGNHALSPLQIDQMLRGYFGWLGTFVVGAGDLIARPMTDQPEKPRPDYWKLATGGMVSDKDSGSSRYVSQMYEQAKELEMAYATYRDLQKKGKTQDAKEYAAEHKEQLNRYGRVEGVKGNMAAMNERIRMIERSTKSAEEKRDLIRKIKDQQDRMARTLVN